MLPRMHIRRILSVDDNEVDLLVNARRISGHDPDIEVREATDGQVALDILSSGDFWPDLVLLDINMPRLDGFGFLDMGQAMFAERMPKVVLTLTSEFQDADIARIPNYPSILGYIIKPMTPGWHAKIAELFESASGL